MNRKFKVGDKVKVKDAVAKKPMLGYSRSWGKNGQVVICGHYGGKSAYRVEFENKARSRAWFYANELTKR